MGTPKEIKQYMEAAGNSRIRQYRPAQFKIVSTRSTSDEIQDMVDAQEDAARLEEAK